MHIYIQFFKDCDIVLIVNVSLHGRPVGVLIIPIITGGTFLFFTFPAPQQITFQCFF